MELLVQEAFDQDKFYDDDRIQVYLFLRVMLNQFRQRKSVNLDTPSPFENTPADAYHDQVSADAIGNSQ